MEGPFFLGGSMVITALEHLNGSKIKVYIDYEYGFLLYQKDLYKLDLEEGMELSQQLYDKIIEETIYRRAKQKAMAILLYKDQSEQDLRKKLLDTGYPAFVVDRTIEYVYSFHYLDDRRYATNYVHYNKTKKSKKILKLELQQKGISHSTIDEVLEEEFEHKEGDPEKEAIMKMVHKKTMDVDSLSIEEKQKLIAKIYRKGFDLSKIKKVLNSHNDFESD